MSSSTDIKKVDFPSGIPIPFVQLSQIQRTYIDWKALGGIITEDEGVREMKHKDLAALLKCSTTWLSACCNNVPNFWSLVDERRREFSMTSRMAHMHKKWYVHASTFKNWQISEAYIRNFDPSYKESKTKVEVEAADSLVEAVSLASKRKQIVEAEVVNAPDSGTSS